MGSLRGPIRVHNGLIDDTPTYSLARYDGVARKLVLSYKEDGRRDLAKYLGGALAAMMPRLPECLPDNSGVWWLVPMPSRRSAARRRGGSHLLRLAEHCARAMARDGLAVAVAPALRLTFGVRDAVGLDPTQRVANLAGRLVFDPRGSPSAGTSAILLDDVITTGATGAAAIKALTANGVIVAAFITLTAAR